ncbi:MAG TPA: NUDIX hydrolase [Streptosporangiaceae bacterium]|nr:NUDIX hydrolase [Streptosporangiaceae bacterium]
MPTDEGRARSRVRVPRGMADRAREFAAAGLRPAEPRDAATVILVRPESKAESRAETRADTGLGIGPGTMPGREIAGVEVYLLLRTQALEFAPGACVFPGGSVDARDADPGIAETGWAGPAPADFGHLLGVPADRARALVCAAVRETFEESGVLLAGPSPAELVPDSADLARDRRALLDGSLSLSELLSRRGLLLRADLLTPWARWITPEISPRRFDTWFFAAALPAGQLAGLAAAGPGESDSGTWWRPAAALEAARAGQITLLPPTAVTLAELAAHQDVAGILGERRMITPLLPTVVFEDERAWLAMPHATEYPL